MKKHMLKREVVLIATVIVAWVCVWIPLALAAARAPVAQTRQTTSFAEGDDGDTRAGVPSPTPRYTDNHNGTVTGKLTGLIWLKNANCFGSATWAQALTDKPRENFLSAGGELTRPCSSMPQLDEPPCGTAPA